MEFVPLGAPLSFGAEVRSAHPLPLGALSPKDVATLRAALLEHQLLIFRDQRELEPADQAAFAKEFGWNPERPPAPGGMSVPGAEGVRVQGQGVIANHLGFEELSGELSNGASQPTALEWHTCAPARPPLAAAGR